MHVLELNHQMALDMSIQSVFHPAFLGSFSSRLFPGMPEALQLAALQQLPLREQLPAVASAAPSPSF